MKIKKYQTGGINVKTVNGHFNTKTGEFTKSTDGTGKEYVMFGDYPMELSHYMWLITEGGRYTTRS